MSRNPDRMIDGDQTNLRMDIGVLYNRAAAKEGRTPETQEAARIALFDRFAQDPIRALEELDGLKIDGELVVRPMPVRKLNNLPNGAGGESV